MQRKVLTVTLNPALDRTYVVDCLKTGGLNIVKSVRTDAGGKGINVARALNKFGLEVLATGLNGGSAGEYLESLLASEGIPFDFFRVLGETRTNTKISDLKSGLTTELNCEGFHVSKEELEGFLGKMNGLVAESGYVVLSGSVPKGVPTGAYADMIGTFGSMGARVILDADNDTLKSGAGALPYAVKPNLKELSRLTGKTVDSDRDILREAKNLIETGIKWVAVTMGERGIILVSGDEAYKATPYPVRAVCTTGAGDAALAAFIYCRKQDLSVSETAAYMTCAGTVTSTMHGTTACDFRDLIDNIARIKLERMEI